MEDEYYKTKKHSDEYQNELVICFAILIVVLLVTGIVFYITG